MKILDCNVFQKWISHLRDYTFRGGVKPKNLFPPFFSFHVYENSNYVNEPDVLLEKDPPPTHPSSSFGVFMLKCPWPDFVHETPSHFHQESGVDYFARDSDYLEVIPYEVRYEIHLKLGYRTVKVIFQMPTEENVYRIVTRRVFLPTLNLTYIDPVKAFQVTYNQNRHGIGIDDSNDYSLPKTQTTSYPNAPGVPSLDSPFDLGENKYFYFNKPFYIHVSIDQVNVLSLYITQTRYSNTS